MPWDETERNMRLFAREVMPAIKKIEPSAAAATPAPADAAATLDVGLLGT
jgi:hypothetical protein